MEIFLPILLFIVGIILIVKGGDFFVDAASWIAEVSGIPKLIVGATIVSLATTLPEMLVSVMAAVQGKVDMAIGNAVGSVNANVALIMAISLIFMPSVVKRRDYLIKSILLILAAGLIAICGVVGEVGLVLSILLIAVFLGFMVDNVIAARRAMITSSEEVISELEKTDMTEIKYDATDNAHEVSQIKLDVSKKRPKPSGREIATNIIKFILGTAAIVYGADLLVDKGSELATMIGISERVISVTLIAVGTSLPELVTTITAIIKKQSSLSVGNIIGANIIDVALIMPLCSIISGQAIPISNQASLIDIPACLLFCCMALLPMLFTGKFRRWQGITLASLYVVFLVITCTVVIA